MVQIWINLNEEVPLSNLTVLFYFTLTVFRVWRTEAENRRIYIIIKIIIIANDLLLSLNLYENRNFQINFTSVGQNFLVIQPFCLSGNSNSKE